MDGDTFGTGSAGFRRMTDPSGQATIASCNAMRDDLVDLRGRVDDGFSRVDDGLPTASLTEPATQSFASSPVNTSNPSVSNSSPMVSGGSRRTTLPNVPQVNTITPAR